MCEAVSFPEITVRLRIDEARRVGDLNIDIPLAEVLRFRRKVRDAMREYAASRALTQQGALT